MKRGVFLLSSMVLAACVQQADVTREEWLAMSAEAKLLTVKSQLGGEVAADAKGGFGKRYPDPAERYVERIDAAYRSGESRTIRELWPALAAGS
jgi:hypothetical protein